MRILVLSNEVWNDKINGNNVVSNWFEGMQAEFANIYCSPEKPFNKCCNEYFQITDKMMMKSIISSKKAGRVLKAVSEGVTTEFDAEKKPQKLYAFLKFISGDWLRFLRELIWLRGRYNLGELKDFIDGFNPDIIFSERMASCKMLRLEEIVTGLTSAPIVAFTGDDEYSLKQFKISPFFWINRFMVRKRLRMMVKKYKVYYTLSLEQKEDYEKRFSCNMKILQKCGRYNSKYTSKGVNVPIRIIYAGKLYCNRWKALSDIVKCLREINREETKAILEIYTNDRLTRRENRLLNDGKCSFVRGAVSQEELKEIFGHSDIVLHVESRDIRNRLVTRLSFSTKIIDCIFSGCAILAYCWKEQSGWKYLKREDAALCVSDKKELLDTLKQVCNNTNIIDIYAEKAYQCGCKSHKKEMIQDYLLKDFEKVVECEKLNHRTEEKL